MTDEIVEDDIPLENLQDLSSDDDEIMVCDFSPEAQNPKKQNELSPQISIVKPALPKTLDPCFMPQTKTNPTQCSYVSCDEPSEAQDCEIDDPQLLDSKKHLMARSTPLSLVNILQNKYKDLLISESLTENLPRHKGVNATYNCIIRIEAPGYEAYQGSSLEPSKQRARQVAAQRFIKSLFTSGYHTWNKAIQMITTVKDPLIVLIKKSH